MSYNAVFDVSLCTFVLFVMTVTLDSIKMENSIMGELEATAIQENNYLLSAMYEAMTFT